MTSFSEIKWNKVHQQNSFFDLELKKFFFMVSTFSVIPIRWVLTVDSEMDFSFSIHSLRVCLFSFKTRAVQQKFIAKLVNSKVNFIRKTDIALIAL